MKINGNYSINKHKQISHVVRKACAARQRHRASTSDSHLGSIDWILLILGMKPHQRGWEKKCKYQVTFLSCKAIFFSGQNRIFSPISSFSFFFTTGKCYNTQKIAKGKRDWYSAIVNRRFLYEMLLQLACHHQRLLPMVGAGPWKLHTRTDTRGQDLSATLFH